jgi:hypothetical protein
MEVKVTEDAARSPGAVGDLVSGAVEAVIVWQSMENIISNAVPHLARVFVLFITTLLNYHYLQIIS